MVTQFKLRSVIQAVNSTKLKGCYVLLITSLLVSLAFAGRAKNNSQQQPVFKSKISPIPKAIQAQMVRFTWHRGCPVAVNNLVYIELSYWGFDKKNHRGALIVNKALASEVVAIYKRLFYHQFPIQKMSPIEFFKGNDNASMAANNTAAFNCREVTGRPGEFSQHSYGRAIDINPLINPYVKGRLVSPKQGRNNLNRRIPALGKIQRGEVVYRIFRKYGWDWGGDWYDLRDYQHFEKRAHSEKRNPYGPQKTKGLES